MNWEGRKSTWHCISFFIDFPPTSPLPPPPFPSFSIIYYLFCIDTFLSLCLKKIEKVFLWLWTILTFQWWKYFHFPFFLLLFVVQRKTLGNKRKSISPRECVCLCYCAENILCEIFVNRKTFFLNKEKFVHNDYFFSLMSCLWNDSRAAGVMKILLWTQEFMEHSDVSLF